MVLRFASIGLLILVAGINCLAQDKCCTCVDGATQFQIPQSGGCEIGCQASRGVSVGVQACYHGLPPGSYPAPPPPDHHCDPYWLQIGGDCKGNHWNQCDLSIKLLSDKPVVGVATGFEFFNNNLGQEYGTRFVGRTRIAMGGSVDWGDNTPKAGLNTWRNRLNHVYEKPGTYVVSAEIHGDFKWNNTSEGASCSYRDRTAPASISIVVSAPPIPQKNGAK